MVEAERDVLAQALTGSLHVGGSVAPRGGPGMQPHCSDHKEEISSDEVETLRKVAALEAALTGSCFLQRLFAMWRGELTELVEVAEGELGGTRTRDSVLEEGEEAVLDKLEHAFFTLNSRGVGDLRDAMRAGRRRSDAAVLRELMGR